MSGDIGTDTDMGTQTGKRDVIGRDSGCREDLIPLKQERHAVAVPAELLAGKGGVYGVVQLLIGLTNSVGKIRGYWEMKVFPPAESGVGRFRLA